MPYNLSIIIPSYNESKTILSILEKIDEVFVLSNNQTQIIIVNNGSNDDSVKKIKTSRFFNNQYFTLLEHKQNQGKGLAIRTAIPYIQGSYAVIQDADLEYNPKDIKNLLNKAKTEDLLVVYGSRNLNKNNSRGKFMFYWGGIIVSFFGNLLFKQKLTDWPTCYKLFRIDVLQSLNLKCKKFEFCPEVTALIAKQKIAIHEIPINYNPRNKLDGKKINWQDGLSALWTMIKIRCQFSKQTKIALLILIISLFFYTLTLHISFSGYEGETAQAGKDLLSGKYNIRRAGLGAVILYIPFILLEKIIPLVALSFVPIFYSALTNIFIFLIINKLIKNIKKSFWISLLIATGSIIWPYSTMGMEYQAMLLITMLLYSLIRYKDNQTNPMYIGLLLAYLSITKSYGCIFVLPTLFFLIRKDNLKNYQLWLKVLLPVVVLFGFNLIINNLIYERLGGIYSVSHEMQIELWWEGFYGIFFSIGESIFIYNPLLIVTLFFWSKFFQQYKSISLFLLMSFGMLLILTAPFSYWSDETWSVRKLVPILPLLHLPLIFINFKKYYWPKKTVIALIIFLALYVQLLGATYNLGKQLSVIRAINQDSLYSMRYIPQLSHWYINHKLLLSYLTTNDRLKYREASWFRWTQKEPDVLLGQGELNLEIYNKPDIYWLDK